MELYHSSEFFVDTWYTSFHRSVCNEYEQCLYWLFHSCSDDGSIRFLIFTNPCSQWYSCHRSARRSNHSFDNSSLLIGARCCGRYHWSVSQSMTCLSLLLCFSFWLCLVDARYYWCFQWVSKWISRKCVVFVSHPRSFFISFLVMSSGYHHLSVFAVFFHVFNFFCSVGFLRLHCMCVFLLSFCIAVSMANNNITSYLQMVMSFFPIPGHWIDTFASISGWMRRGMNRGLIIGIKEEDVSDECMSG